MYIVIVNSFSGQRRYRRIIRQLNQQLSYSFITYFSHNYQGEAMWDQIAIKVREINKEIKGVLVVGGDGTLHQVINHMHQYNLPFGLLAAGSGNDFGRALKVPLNTQKAIDRINTGVTKKYDLIEVNNKIVLSVVGIGVDAETAIRCQTSLIKKLLNRAFLGRLTYLAVFLQTVFRYRSLKVEVTDQDGKSHSFERVWLMAAGNTSYYGGGIPICPEADPHDGEIDLVVVHGLGFFRLLTAIPTVYLKKHLSLPYVTMLRGKKFTVLSKTAQAVQGDGEEIGKTPAIISIHKKAVKFF